MIQLLYYSTFFFFLGYGDHRDLNVLTHSFPTRRSSDLDLGIPDQRQADGTEDEAHDEDDGEARHQCGGHDFQDTIVIAANGLHDLAGSGTGGAWGRQESIARRRWPARPAPRRLSRKDRKSKRLNSSP